MIRRWFCLVPPFSPSLILWAGWLQGCLIVHPWCSLFSCCYSLHASSQPSSSYPQKNLSGFQLLHVTSLFTLLTQPIDFQQNSDQPALLLLTSDLPEVSWSCFLQQRTITANKQPLNITTQRLSLILYVGVYRSHQTGQFQKENC
ncbi:hypothetical protein ATANTOWER_004681 [Ataeniobius toweri]|uniref:Secreted protein n=1 Tax=Ataeniobius toweri TaxID=208326 RepID=A0ABU7BDS7_9TELE|nr:hypothetical protein [Ataeniobius toweri]